MSQTSHIITFLGVLSLALGLEHIYIFVRLSHYLNLSGTTQRSIGLIIFVLAIATLTALPAMRYLSREAAEPVLAFTFTWMGIAFLLMVVLLVTDLLWLLYNLSPAELPHDPERRIFIHSVFGYAALGAAGLLSGYSVWGALRPVAVKPLSITLNRLPKALDGLRIVQITDLHIGAMINRRWLQGIVDKVNALKPDLIAITGDLIDGTVQDLKDQVEPIAGLKARLGVYYITGNHEYYFGVEDWCAHVASLGLRVLRNERVTITGPKGETFDLAGVDDWAANRFPGEAANLSKALKGRDPKKPLILLAHQPAAIDEASQHGVDLQLSGHTHGGQIWPFSYLVYLQQPYIKGLHNHRDTQIYVSEGTGFWGPPMRLGTSAEITHITLHAGA
jgi:uncharacterized protein